MKKNKIKYKLHESKIKALLTSAKKIFKKKDRAFNMLKREKNNEPVINSKIHRSIK